MKVRPKKKYQVIGTNLRLDPEQTYEAEWSTSKWAETNDITITQCDLDIQLSESEYEIIKEDEQDD